MRIKKSILIIDDDKLLTWAVQRLLEDDGHEVSCCYNGPDAIALSKEKHFDVILTDYHMPDMKGDAVCRLLRHHRPNAFIIGCSSDQQDRAFLNAGADTFINKEELVQSLTALMDSGTTHLIDKAV